MSRIGKLPISIPAGVTVTLKDDVVTVKGPKGELSQLLILLSMLPLKTDMCFVRKRKRNDWIT